MGDSYLGVDKNSITFRHCKKQEEYIRWKHNQLQNIANDIYEHITPDNYEYLIFRTKSNDYLRNFLYKKLRLLCLSKGKKTVTRRWLNMLTPLSLAIWWMDDGCLSIHKGNRYGKLSTHCFSYKEHLIIKKYFAKVWNIDIQITVEKKKYYFCRLNVENLKKLITLIYPYVIQIPSMIYKIDLNYKNNTNLGDFIDIYNQIKFYKNNCISY